MYMFYSKKSGWYSTKLTVFLDVRMIENLPMFFSVILSDFLLFIINILYF